MSEIREDRTVVPAEVYDKLAEDRVEEPNEALRQANQRRKNLVQSVTDATGYVTAVSAPDPVPSVSSSCDTSSSSSDCSSF